MFARINKMTASHGERVLAQSQQSGEQAAHTDVRTRKHDDASCTRKIHKGMRSFGDDGRRGT